MGKRLPRNELLTEILKERTRLVAVLDSIPEPQLTIGELNDAGWSIKDILAHLIDWESRVVDWYEAGLDGLQPQLPAAGFTWKDLPALNEQIYKKHCRRSVKSVQREFESTHERTIAAIERMSDEELTVLGHYAWTGRSWTLSDYIRANTASHYRWATKKIRKWLQSKKVN